MAFYLSFKVRRTFENLIALAFKCTDHWPVNALTSHFNGKKFPSQPGFTSTFWKGTFIFWNVYDYFNMIWSREAVLRFLFSWKWHSSHTWPCRWRKHALLSAHTLDPCAFMNTTHTDTHTSSITQSSHGGQMNEWLWINNKGWAGSRDEGRWVIWFVLCV